MDKFKYNSVLLIKKYLFNLLKTRYIIIPLLFFLLLIGTVVNRYYSVTSRMSGGYTYSNINIPADTYICLTEDEKFAQHYQIFYKYDLRSKELSNINQEIIREQKYLSSDFYVQRDGITLRELNNMEEKREKYLERKKNPFSHPAFCGRNEYIIFQITKGDNARFLHKYLIFGFFILLLIEWTLVLTLKIEHDVSRKKTAIYYSITTISMIILVLSYWFYFIASHLG